MIGRSGVKERVTPLSLNWTWESLQSIICGVRPSRQRTDSKQSLSDLSPEIQEAKPQLTWFQ